MHARYLKIIIPVFQKSKEYIVGNFIKALNAALYTGVSNIKAVTEYFGNTGTITGEDLKNYLSYNIDFYLDDEKKKAMDLFLRLLKELQEGTNNLIDGDNDN